MSSRIGIVPCAAQKAEKFGSEQVTVRLTYPVVGVPNDSLKLGMRKPFDQVPRSASSRTGVIFTPTFGEKLLCPVLYLS